MWSDFDPFEKFNKNNLGKNNLIKMKNDMLFVQQDLEWISVILLESVQIVVSEDDHTFTLNEKALKKLLLDSRVKDTKVVVVSVAGAFRKGKSFLLDFLLRYLHAKGADNWMGGENEPLVGFPWKGGSERMTNGILMWKEPFMVTLPSGETACVLLMDTQGAFDSMSTVKDCATVFALSTMLSSVQVYNLTGNIQEDDLQHLQLFTEYGRLAMEGTKTKPFQDLHFLVRDWPYAYQHEYGTKGGSQILERRLVVADGQHKELQQLRIHLKNCFSKISCYLLPHPGLKVATNPKFDGRLADIEEDFRVHVKAFVESLLNQQNLIVKEINGSQITGKELIEYFKSYVRLFQSDELPEPKSVLEATAEANNLAAVASAKDVYSKEMEQVCGGDKAYIRPETLATEHKQCKEKALSLFHSVRKMGGATFSEDYAFRLNIELERMYDSYVKHNAAKNVMTGMQTPMTLLVLAVCCYLAAGVCGMVGLYTSANCLNACMFLIVALITMWTYTRVTGKLPGLGTKIDNSVLVIHKLTKFIVRPRQPSSDTIEEKKTQ